MMYNKQSYFQYITISCLLAIKACKLKHYFTASMSEQQAITNDRVTYSALQQVENFQSKKPSCLDSKKEAEASSTPVYTMVSVLKKESEQITNPMYSALNTSPASMYDDIITNKKMDSVTTTTEKDNSSITKSPTDSSPFMYDKPIGKKDSEQITKELDSPNNADIHEAVALGYSIPQKSISNKIRSKQNCNCVTMRNCILWLFTLTSLLIFAVIAALIAILFSQVSSLRNNVNSKDLNIPELQATLKEIDIIKDYNISLQSMFEEIDLIKKLITNLSFQQNSSKDNSMKNNQQNKINDLNSFLLTLYNFFVTMGNNASHPAPSCCFILYHNPTSTSGFYWIRSVGQAVKVFCYMSDCELLVSEWTKVASFDLTKNGTCPANLKNIYNGITYCGLPNQTSLCSSTYFSSGRKYSNVFGAITGYGYGSLDGFNHDLANDIDATYLDGVSLTYREETNRKHIWSFIARAYCSDDVPCSRGLPSFVDSSYSCDTANNDAVLWDENPCKTISLPWFFKQLPRPTMSDIEMRLCRDDGEEDEELGISYFELYIQ